jgi:hypothetical protein
MKIRTGFVSNSSSSSFTINKRYISAYQMDQIINHIDSAKKEDEDRYYFYDEWIIEETDEELRGHTSMDNFDMKHFLENVVGVKNEYIRWDWY